MKNYKNLKCSPFWAPNLSHKMLNPIKIRWKTRKNCYRYLKLTSPLNVAICATINYTLWVEWYYIENNYLILRSKIKVPRRSLRYATHCLMVMHIRTIFQWTVLLDLFELFDIEVNGQSPTKVITVGDTALWSCTYDLSVNEQFCWIYLNDLTLRSKVITVHDTPPYGHAPTYQLSLTYLERQKCFGPDKKILLKLEAPRSLYSSPGYNNNISQ